jgi:hypothetical protein
MLWNRQTKHVCRPHLQLGTTRLFCQVMNAGLQWGADLEPACGRRHGNSLGGLWGLTSSCLRPSCHFVLCGRGFSFPLCPWTTLVFSQGLYTLVWAVSYAFVLHLYDNILFVFSFFCFGVVLGFELGLCFEPLYQPFFVKGFFQDRVSIITWLWIEILLISACWVAKITGLSQQCLASFCFFLRKGLAMWFWDGLELSTLLPQPHNCWDYRCILPLLSYVSV